jgi:hypothetical protein
MWGWTDEEESVDEEGDDLWVDPCMGCRCVWAAPSWSRGGRLRWWWIAGNDGASWGWWLASMEANLRGDEEENWDCQVFTSWRLVQENGRGYWGRVRRERWVSAWFVFCSYNWEGKEAVVVQRPKENEGWAGRLGENGDGDEERWVATLLVFVKREEGLPLFLVSRVVAVEKMDFLGFPFFSQFSSAPRPLNPPPIFFTFFHCRVVFIGEVWLGHNYIDPSTLFFFVFWIYFKNKQYQHRLNKKNQWL